MATTSLQFIDSTAGPLHKDGDNVTVELPHVFVVKTVANSEDTLWYQAGRIHLRDAEIESGSLDDKKALSSGRIQVNQYTYLDMLPVPQESPGYIRLQFDFADGTESLVIQAEYLLLEMDGDAKYIKHLE